MPLQPASTAKTSSDGALIKERSVLNSLTMTAINTKITAQSTRTDLDVKTLKTEFTFNAYTNGGTSPTEIIQSNNSRILLSDLEGALTDASYKISVKTIRASRLGIYDKVKLQVSWG